MTEPMVGLVSKSDLRLSLAKLQANLRYEFRNLERRLTTRTGAFAAAVVAVIVPIDRLF